MQVRLAQRSLVRSNKRVVFQSVSLSTESCRKSQVTLIRSLSMEEKPAATAVLGNAIVEWLADEALQNSEPANLYGELCQRLRGVGIPILRGQVAFRILHPLYDASTLNWNTQRGVVQEHFRPEQSNDGQFMQSPMGYVVAH